MTIVNKKHLSFFIILIIFTSSTLVQTNILAHNTKQVYQLKYTNNLVEITKKIVTTNNKNVTYITDSETRKYYLNYIYNDTNEFSLRYLMALVYSKLISKGTEEMVLFLLAAELAKIYDAVFMPAINTFLIFKEDEWCILLQHGTEEGNIDKGLLDMLSSSFNRIILASCFSENFASQYKNMIGFSGVVTVSSLLNCLSTQIGKTKSLYELKNSPICKYTLLVTAPDSFINLGGWVWCVLDLLSSINTGGIIGDFVIDPYFNQGIDDKYVRLETGEQSSSRKYGAAHINYKIQYGSLPDINNYHLEEVCTSLTGAFVFTTCSMTNSISVNLVKFLPSVIGPDNAQYIFSYVIIGSSPVAVDLGIFPYYTVITYDVGPKFEGDVFTMLFAGYESIRFLSKKYGNNIVGANAIVPVPHLLTRGNSVQTLSTVMTDYIACYGAYVDGLTDEIIDNIIDDQDKGGNYIFNTYIKPVMEILGKVVLAIFICAIIVAIAALIIPIGVASAVTGLILIALILGFIGGGFSLKHISLDETELQMDPNNPCQPPPLNEPDEDNDRISDTLEEYYYNTYIAGTPQEPDYIGQEKVWLNANVDYDADGLMTIIECECNLDPFDSDSDNNGVSDSLENYSLNPYTKDYDSDLIADFIEEQYFHQYIAGTPQEPDYIGQEKVWLNANVDYDADGLSTLIEISYQSNPFEEDTDKDTILDQYEIEKIGSSIWYHSNPYLTDSDFDGLGDYEEQLPDLENIELNPLNPDTDNDGLTDGWEIYANVIGWDGVTIDYSFVDPLDNPRDPITHEYVDWVDEDIDYDGFTNAEESWIFTNPMSSDTDNDNLFDYDEMYIFNTDPTNTDSDFDGLNDYNEINTYYTDPQNGDTDYDQMADGWEVQYGLNPLVYNGDEDPDSDNLCNREEHKYQTNPNEEDTDGDGLLDGEEAHTYNTSPICADTDSDLLSDSAEVLYHNSNPFKFDTDNDLLGDYNEVIIYDTNPLVNDTDGDNILDGYEIYFQNTDPLDSDTDNDGLLDGDELIYDTDPTNCDTDGDGMQDGWEIDNNFNPLSHDSSGDADSDGASNLNEFLYNTDPQDSDTDNDGMPDGWEIDKNLNPLVNDAAADPDNDGLTNFEEYQINTTPYDSDTDNDGMPDGWEATYNLNPLVDDANLHADSDWLKNIDEYTFGTNPTENDTDGDGLDDWDEIAWGTNPLVDDDHLDYDSDGLTNYEEIKGLYDYNGDGDYDDPDEHTGHHTDPNDADTDNDGYGDGYEIDPNLPYNPSDPNDPNSVPSIGGGGIGFG